MSFRSALFLLTATLTAAAPSGCGSSDSDLASESTALTKSCHGAPYPIILAHGMAGFDHIGPVNYFFNVAADLRHRGETVVESQVAPFESSAVRAAELAQFVDDTLASTGACKVNLIAHSQGGLDARYLISSLGYGDRIAGLVTVSSPHLGSPVADVALGLVPGSSYDVINAILHALWGVTGAPGDAKIQASLHQLSRDNMSKHFNPSNRDDSRVKYYSVAGRSAARIGSSECAGGRWANSWRVDLLDPLLTVTEPVFVLTSPNPLSPLVNDGLVTVESARWGTFLGCVPADHLDEVGQLAHLLPDLLSGFDHKALYRKIVDELHHDGL